MGIVPSLALIAVGAILKWGVTADANGINIDTVGVILLVIGIIGLVLSLDAVVDLVGPRLLRPAHRLHGWRCPRGPGPSRLERLRPPPRRRGRGRGPGRPRSRRASPLAIAVGAALRGRPILAGGAVSSAGRAGDF